MRKNLCNFSIKRSGKEAFVFYLAYLLLGMLITFFAGAILGLINPLFTDEMAIVLGRIIGTIYFIILHFTVYVKKGFNSFKHIIIGIIGAIITIFTGLIIPLIFTAYLTTKDSEIETEESQQ